MPRIDTYTPTQTRQTKHPVIFTSRVQKREYKVKNRHGRNCETKQLRGKYS